MALSGEFKKITCSGGIFLSRDAPHYKVRTVEELLGEMEEMFMTLKNFIDVCLQSHSSDGCSWKSPRGAPRCNYYPAQTTLKSGLPTSSHREHIEMFSLTANV